MCMWVGWVGIESVQGRMEGAWTRTCTRTCTRTASLVLVLAIGADGMTRRGTGTVRLQL